ncbi:MAG: hypothetical protein HC903_30810, partial [Methylacidiphilales bacterium]|nr:hypothetical protein [Candidatus Methylacidiphilales bacterium]
LVKANQIGLAVIAAAGNATNLSDWNATFGTGTKTIRQRLGAGDTQI